MKEGKPFPLPLTCPSFLLPQPGTGDEGGASEAAFALKLFQNFITCFLLQDL